MADGMSPSFEPTQLARLLTWQEESPALELLRSCYEQHLEQCFQSRCDALDGDVQCIAESLDLLPAQQRYRFLRSPLVASLLLTQDQGSVLDYHPIARGLLAELAMAGMVDELQ